MFSLPLPPAHPPWGGEALRIGSIGRWPRVQTNPNARRAIPSTRIRPTFHPMTTPGPVDEAPACLEEIGAVRRKPGGRVGSFHERWRELPRRHLGHRLGHRLGPERSGDQGRQADVSRPRIGGMPLERQQAGSLDGPNAVMFEQDRSDGLLSRGFVADDGWSGPARRSSPHRSRDTAGCPGSSRFRCHPWLARVHGLHELGDRARRPPPGCRLLGPPR